MATFADVTAILDKSIGNWRTAHHRGPNLAKHQAGDPTPFGWSTRDELLQSAAFGLPLINPQMIGNGRSRETNLYLALAQGVPGYPRMPNGGPFLSSTDTDTIAAWIDAGAP
jgi:hypothetical protein